MTLEEAIIHCKEKSCDNTQCALEHRQLAEWLKELQSLRSNKNEIISPYFENGVFAGVRVTLGDEDFVIEPKDYQNGEEMDWQSAMDALKAEGLDTWNYRQICLTMAYRGEIEIVLDDNGGDNLCRDYWTGVRYGNHRSFYYDGFYGFLGTSNNDNACSVRPIKNLKK